ncbi:hypothetical protein D3C78_1191790 [compost metagenome]
MDVPLVGREPTLAVFEDHLSVGSQNQYRVHLLDHFTNTTLDVGDHVQDRLVVVEVLDGLEVNAVVRDDVLRTLDKQSVPATRTFEGELVAQGFIDRLGNLFIRRELEVVGKDTGDEFHL